MAITRRHRRSATVGGVTRARSQPTSTSASTRTSSRHTAVAGSSDLVLVTGSANSANSQRLVELAIRQGVAAAHLVDDATQIRPEWLVETVSALSGLGALTVTEHEVTRETVTFSVPSVLRHT